MVINCEHLLKAVLATMSDMDTFDSHAFNHHQPNGCERESSGLTEYHQRKHFEGCSHRSHCLIASPFLPLQPIARPVHAVVVMHMQA